jgi:hypothetical protein
MELKEFTFVRKLKSLNKRKFYKGNHRQPTHERRPYLQGWLSSLK